MTSNEEETGRPSGFSIPSLPALKPYAPAYSPVLWSYINAFVLLWSFLMVLEILDTQKRLYRLEGTQEYMTWSFGTTLVWFMEVGLTINNQERLNNWKQAVEIILAIFFLGDSIHNFQRWKHADKHIEGEIVDAAINTVAYGFMLWESVHFQEMLRGRRQADDYEEIV